MRVLITVQPGWGHLLPMLPLVRTLQRADHHVRVAISPSMVEVVRAYGVEATAVGARWDQAGFGACDVHPGPGPFFVRAAATAVGDILSELDRFQPDLVIRDCTEFAGWVAATVSGTLHASWGIHLRFAGPALAAAAGPTLAELLARWGADSDPELTRLEGCAFLDVVPQPFYPEWWPRSPVSLPVYPFERPMATSRAAAGDRPLVHISLGTVPYPRGDLLRTCVTAAADLPVDVLVASGDQRAEMVGVPSNVKVIDHVDHTSVLPRCTAVINHAGTGTVLKSIDAGVPQVWVPIAAEQPATAFLAQRLGIGISAANAPDIGPFPTTDPTQLTVEHVRDSLRHVLSDDSFGQATRMVQANLRQQLPLPAAVKRLEEHVRLTRESRSAD